MALRGKPARVVEGEQKTEPKKEPEGGHEVEPAMELEGEPKAGRF